MQFVKQCYGLRGIYGRFDSKIRFKIESDGRFDSRFDSNEKNDSQVPSTKLLITTGTNSMHFTSPTYFIQYQQLHHAYSLILLVTHAIDVIHNSLV